MFHCGRIWVLINKHENRFSILEGYFYLDYIKNKKLYIVDNLFYDLLSNLFIIIKLKNNKLNLRKLKKPINKILY